VFPCNALRGVMKAYKRMNCVVNRVQAFGTKREKHERKKRIKTTRPITAFFVVWFPCSYLAVRVSVIGQRLHEKGNEPIRENPQMNLTATQQSFDDKSPYIPLHHTSLVSVFLTKTVKRGSKSNSLQLASGIRRNRFAFASLRFRNTLHGRRCVSPTTYDPTD
jgi:hypothetical protein